VKIRASPPRPTSTFPPLFPVTIVASSSGTPVPVLRLEARVA
jgi:hypothetical protein